MHRALYIEEILLNIFRHCYRGARRRKIWHSCYANVYLTTLARTCRAFKDPVLDMIWVELNDLTPLVRCLPRDSWVKVPGRPGVRQLWFSLLAWFD